VCGTVCSGFGGVSTCCVWDSLVWVWGSESVLCVGQFGAGLGALVCCRWLCSVCVCVRNVYLCVERNK